MAPESDGGSPVTGYVVEVCKSGAKGWTKAGQIKAGTLTFEVTGLIPGEYYFLRVFAQNDVGVGRKAADLREPVCAKRPTSMLN